MTINQKNDTEEKEKYIVGIGASAGGLEALQKLLTALPSNTGYPYIIVQHLSPDYKSLLGEILSKYTDMPVVQVEDGMVIKPDFVYVIQPGKNMSISDGKLILSSQKEKELNLPIDMFFRSLAEEAKDHAIAIVLSGTGSDGTNGIRSIKENDGMIMVQEPESAKFDGMPRSAIRTGLVDAQLTPEEIALELQHISNATQEAIPEKTERQVDEELMRRIYAILKKISNVNFTHYKQNTILRRIERRMMLTHKETLQEYVDYLYESSEEVRTLSREVLIGVTNFFRDPEFFQCLKDNAIQDILLHSTAEEQIRVWVAGCSTGEEAYSIAILFCEVMETMKIKRSIKIFATDLDVEAVTFAGKGTYSESIIDSVSPARLSHYFTRQNNSYTINRDIRKMIVFSPHNVFQDPPFGRLDLISCRNMLIYFQPVLQNDLFAIFHTSLKDGGYLFLGKSEAIGVYTEAYPVVDAAAKLFKHRADVKIAGAKAIPYLQNGLMDDDYLDPADAHMPRRVLPGEMSAHDQNSIDTALLERFMPACLIVDEKNELVHTFGENSNYVHFPVGRVSSSLYDVITEGLKIPVSTLLKEAREKGQMVQYKDISFMGERENVVINLTAMPISGRRDNNNDQYYALVFTDTKQRGELEEAVPYEIDRAASQRITDLEQDLSEAQDRLQRSVSEQECVNEELQAANEELLTANEELQSSNEELQSVNEELYTVNTEYQLKLTELADTNDDIANFLSSTLIGVIFVDNKLSIRRYTDYVASEFSVMDHDIGRSLKFISYHFPTVDITEICENVLKTLVPDEREVTTGKNKVFFMRVAPYRTTENKILGCVITLVDTTTQKQGLVKLKNTEQRLNLAQQANEAKSDFLSKIAHEIRMPMSELTEAAVTAGKQLEDKEALGRSLEKMSDTIQYMNSIVSDILEMTRTDQFDVETPIEPFAIRDLIERVSASIIPGMDQAGLNYEVTIKENLEDNYIGSRTRLQQILTNFLTNAMKYTPKGGHVKLEVSEDAVVNHKASIHFKISDNGIGISEKFIPELFKPFARENRNDDKESTSMGLGLSIAYNLIKLMNGDVKVESELGRGTTFDIHVLLERYVQKDGTPARLSAIEDMPDYHLVGLHALVVDDNKMNRKILGAILANEGMTFDEADDGATAVETYLQSPDYKYDCILMDIRMPEVDGIEATRQIRNSKKPDAVKIPIIVVSANGFPEDRERAQKAGIDSYRTKPINNQKLFETIQELVRRNGKEI